MEQTGKNSTRTPTSWDAEDDILLMHLKDQQKLGWKEIASHFTNRTPNACQFRWRRLKSGNLKNPPKSISQQASGFNKSETPEKAKKKVEPSENTPNRSNSTPFAGVSTGLTFTGYDNNVSSALAGLNALSNTPSQVSTPNNYNSQANTPQNNYDSPLDPPPQPPRGPHTGGGYYAEISVDPTMNLPQNQPHPPVTSPKGKHHAQTSVDSNGGSSGSGTNDVTSGTNSSIGSGNGISSVPNSRRTSSIAGITSVPNLSSAGRRASVILPSLHNNSIIQIVKDDRTSISSATRASVSSLPSKSMNIPHHQSGNNALAHLPVLFGGTGGSISGPSPNPSVSGPPGILSREVASLRNGSIGSGGGVGVPTPIGNGASVSSPGYYSRSGSVVIPYNSDKKGLEPYKADKKYTESRKEDSKTEKGSSKTSNNNSAKKENEKPSIFKIPWSMEEDELLINRRNRELSFAELSILLPQRTEGEIWSRIDHLEKLRNGHRTQDSKRRQSSIGLDDVEGFYDEVMIDSEDEDDEDDDVILEVDDSLPNARKKKRRASSAVNPLSVDRKRFH